jgi:hypothetical protein
MRGLSRRAREIGADAFRRRDPIACVVFAPDAADAEPELEEDDEARRTSDQLAMVFRQAGRASDAIGRMGHSEYGVIAPATGPEAAVRMVRRLGGVIESSPIAVRGGERTLRLRAGYCAVPDFAESSVDAVELLLRATTALRDLKRDGQNEERIRAFEQVPTKYAN